MKKRKYIEPEVKKQNVSEVIPAHEGLVFEDKGYILNAGKDFETPWKSRLELADQFLLVTVLRN